MMMIRLHSAILHNEYFYFWYFKYIFMLELLTVGSLLQQLSRHNASLLFFHFIVFLFLLHSYNLSLF